MSSRPVSTEKTPAEPVPATQQTPTAPAAATPPAKTPGRWPRVVIVGGGFGGLYAAKELRNRRVVVTVIDRTNHHLFQPLLYQVATAVLAPGDIAQPIRHILKDAKNVDVVVGDVTEIDLAGKRVITKETREFPYDYLIVAAGSRHSYFGNDQWEAYAPGLKSLEDALELRRRILNAFEAAEMMTDKEARKAALTFVVVGAGPTGVEMAGAISELANHSLAEDFRNINTKSARVILLDGAPRVLPTFAEPLSESALKQLKKLNVEVHTNKIVSEVSPEGVRLKDEFIPARTVVWAAGNAASPLAKQLGAEVDRAGRVLVNPDLTLPNHPEVFALGDMVNFSHQDGKPLPGLCQTAMQMGRYAGKAIYASAYGGGKMPPFKYFDKGSMATIGRFKAVADVHVAKFGGLLAWLMWVFVHLVFLIGLRNQIGVFVQWTWAYLTYSRGSRLIYGAFKPRVAPPKPFEPLAVDPAS